MDDMKQCRRFMMFSPKKSIFVYMISDLNTSSARYTYLLTEEDRIKEFVKDRELNARGFSMTRFNGHDVKEKG